MIWDFGCFPWSCTNLVIEQLIIPSSKHLSHPVAYFIHHATSVARRMQVNQNSILNMRYLHGKRKLASGASDGPAQLALDFVLHQDYRFIMLG